MARLARYKPDNKSFGRFILSEQMRDVTAEVARDIAALATTSAPPPSSDTDPEAIGATYTVNREAGVIVVAGNPRVKVTVTGRGAAALRAEFAFKATDKRHRTLAVAGGQFGDWKFPEKEFG